MNRSGFIRLLLLAPLGGQRLFAAESGIGRSVDFLLARQSPDGAWRDDTYGAFHDGRALTPVVLRCLARLPDPSLDRVREKAARWLTDQGDRLFENFPVHLAAAVLETHRLVPSLSPLRRSAVSRLLELQTESGAWSYSPVSPARNRELPPMQQPNLSATAIAIDGLRSAGNEDTAILAALPFVMSCQNHGGPDPDFDDGGFFQMPLDPARNKAGKAGTDREGRTRFRSYAAATADGLRCLLAAGEAQDVPAVGAARNWLDAFTWQSDGAPADLAYYSARSILLAATVSGGRTAACDTLPHALARIRRADGSWINPAGEMRENCPLVATSLALEAIALNIV